MNTMTMHLAHAFDAPKHHLSPSQTRRYAVEMPVGDATGGPAYGQRPMPVIVVAAAAMSFASGFAMATAIGASLTSMVIGGAMMVGAALTVVGTVTGNEKLTKIGGVISLVGGVAAIAQTAIGAAGAAGALGETAGAVGAEQLAGPGMDSVAGVTGGATAGVDGAVQLAGPGMGGAAEAAAGAAAPPGLIGSATDAASGAIPAGIDPAAAPLSTQAGNTMVTDTLPTSSSFDIGDKIDAFSKWTNENPKMAEMGGKALQGVAGNLVTSDTDKAKIDYYNAHTEATRQKTADEQRRALWRRGLISA